MKLARSAESETERVKRNKTEKHSSTLDTSGSKSLIMLLITNPSLQVYTTYSLILKHTHTFGRTNLFLVNLFLLQKYGVLDT